MTIGDLDLPAAMLAQYPAAMRLRIEDGRLFAYQHTDFSGGRWMIGWVGGGTSPSDLRASVVEYHSPDYTSRY